MPTYIEKTAIADEMQTLKDKASALCKKYHVLAENDSWQKATQAYRTVCDVVIAIEALPTIDAEPVRHGHWSNFTSSTEECSCCGHEFYISALFSVGYNDEPPFCPNCGAKMDRERREDETD